MRQKYVREYGNFAAALIVLFVVPFAAPRPARAEFIQTTSTGVYQSDRTKVILSHKQGAQGIFVAHFKDAIAPQEFNPEKLPQENVSHVFVKFDPNSEYQYSEVVIGEKTYTVAGNLNIWLTPNGSVSVNIDNMNPYMTITQRDAKGNNDALVGFYGMTEIVKGTGNLATILSANQLSPEVAKILKPYVVSESGLTINNNEVSTPSIGIFVRRDHECLKSSQAVSLLTLGQLKSIQSSKVAREQSQLLDKYLKENRQKSPIQGHLILRAETSGPMILLNIGTKDIFDMRPIKNSFSKKKICVISPIE